MLLPGSVPRPCALAALPVKDWLVFDHLLTLGCLLTLAGRQNMVEGTGCRREPQLLTGPACFCSRSCSAVFTMETSLDWPLEGERAVHRAEPPRPRPCPPTAGCLWCEPGEDQPACPEPLDRSVSRGLLRHKHRCFMISTGGICSVAMPY